MVRSEGIEPTTSGLGIPRSILLSYDRIFIYCCNCNCYSVVEQYNFYNCTEVFEDEDFAYCIFDGLFVPVQRSNYFDLKSFLIPLLCSYEFLFIMRINRYRNNMIKQLNLNFLSNRSNMNILLILRASLYLCLPLGVQVCKIKFY